MLKKQTLIIELAQRGHTAIHPVSLGLVGLEVNKEDKVCGVTGGGQHSSPGTGLVHGTRVTRYLGKFVGTIGLQPNLKVCVKETDNNIHVIETYYVSDKTPGQVCVIYVLVISNGRHEIMKNRK